MRLTTRGWWMSGYRLYFMDRYSGHIEHRREFLADDDASAIDIATSWSTGQPMELWVGTHKLRRWDAEAVRPGAGWIAVSEVMSTERQQKYDRNGNADQPEQDGTHQSVSYTPARDK